VLREALDAIATQPEEPDAAQPEEDPSVGFYRRLLAFYTPAYALRWLYARRELFGHGEASGYWRSAIEAIKEGRADVVDAEINRLESGAYV